jgi:vesicular inhibitory amino acid transporter
MEKHDESGLIKAHGLSLLVAGVFLAGEMAGSGVLALPHAMVGTGRTNRVISLLVP